MTKQAKHTPLPWDIHEGEDYLSIFNTNEKNQDSDVLLLELPSARDEENARFIVRACNNHYQLVGNLGATTEILEILHAKSDSEETRKLLGTLIVANRDILARAKGGA